MNLKDMLALLDEYFQKKEDIEKSITKLVEEHSKVIEDIEMMEMFIMYKSNRGGKQ